MIIYLYAQQCNVLSILVMQINQKNVIIKLYSTHYCIYGLVSLSTDDNSREVIGTMIQLL
jgi:hypothetical protein